MRNILPSSPSTFWRFMISLWQCSQFFHETYQVLYNLVGNVGVYYLLQWAGLFKTGFLSHINILVWEGGRNGENMRNKFEGSSLPVLSSPRFVCIQRGGRSERCSHTSQIQFAWLIPCSASGFSLCWVNTSLPEPERARRREVCALPTPWHLELAVVSTGVSQLRSVGTESSPGPLLARSIPHPLLPSQTDRFCNDLFHGVLKGNVIAASADPQEIHERAFGSGFVRNLEKN